jgi:hypothetical protein
MTKTPSHRHKYTEYLFEETGGVDRKGRVTVFTTRKCNFRGCTKTRRTRTKNTYFVRRDI